MTTSYSQNKPVEVLITQGASLTSSGSKSVGSAAASTATATVAVIVVTWNRYRDVDNIVRSLSRQEYPRERMHVIVVDNSSTDGTLNRLDELWSPDLIVENATDKAHEPRFEPLTRRNARGPATGANKGDFASLTIIRNHANLGGCGGFNTGLSYIAHAMAAKGNPPDFAWLVDDDADVPPNALVELTKAAASDPKIGLVGSRTVDIANRHTTIESTIYLNRANGIMGDEPTLDHPQRKAYEQWIATVGSPRGEARDTGLRDVDVVSACSMLARWSAVEQVGFWDWRYFIYCDDADWCLRFGKAGYRVVLNLDAAVYHTPWNMKLTIARIYYAQRNLLWMLQKVMPPEQLRRILKRRMYSILRDSLRAGLHRRLFHAEIIRRTALDVVTNRAGKLDNDGPTPEPVMDSLRKAGVLKKDRRIAVLCSAHPSVGWADQLRHHVAQHLNVAGGEAMPAWTYVVRNDVPDHGGHGEPAETRPYRLVYGARRRARLRRQYRILTQRPDLIVVYDQTTDFPAVLGTWNLHIDTRKLTTGQLERDGFVPRMKFLSRWSAAAVRCVWYALTAKPFQSTTRYG
ncbi:MAG: glycosyltransferase family 2 protein [Pyrinomonadaceae bacterium]|nr:glycosyltransferase family 2 protein [Phycisphaerales bacterium]